jgi:molybdopterin molybdotransferase
MITPMEAAARITAAVAPGDTETVGLDQAAGRVLRRALLADTPAPPFDRVMMDGVALAAADWSSDRFYRCLQGAPAGHRPPPRPDAESVVSVSTGGVLPPGCDCVAPREWLEETDRGLRIIPRNGTTLTAGRFVHARGSDGPKGRQVLPAGILLGAAELAVAATEGAMRVNVNRPPRVCLLTTGDEVVPPDQCPGPAEIRGSHATALATLLQDWGETHFSHLHVLDQREVLRDAIGKALVAVDMVVLTGGVSRGDYDFVPQLLAEHGVTCIFHGVAQKPGKPLWFGGRESTTVFGLPGNPNSALVCARRYVIPALARWRGGEALPVLPGTVRQLPPRLPGLTHFVPVRLSDRNWLAVPTATSGSLHPLAGTHGFAECPPAAGEVVGLHLWRPI